MSRFADFLRLAGDSVVETVYPKRCAGCGIRGQWVCLDCESTQPRFSRPWCERCGAPPLLSKCRCEHLDLAINKFRSSTPDRGWMKSAIRDFKYSGESARAEHLSQNLIPLLDDLGPIDLLVPVPLHPSRERERGYNQSKLLADLAGKSARLEVREVLIRSRRTDHQVGLDAQSRRQNVQGAFALRAGADVKDLRCVLVDDVSTTGSTLANCARALHHGGAAWIGAVTLAREE